ncbi:hypothetical protein NDU88_009663 [Pleurodeles waltl]|uniref:Uncharacterized protein n=1 Tax=Pleurodeles waltl TaxID=8319 RepID=A0AAV7RYZ4_PLEWA|nr:hypothetical protein NDU88_009663 [Pleurodeles waltl]
MSFHTNRREQRDHKLQQVFNTTGVGTSHLSSPNLLSARSTFLALEKSLKKETSKWWEIASLKKYLENDRIPRGLRILIFPPMDTTSQEHLQKWETNLKMASINMINQLIEISEEEYDKHRKEVDNLTQRIEEANWGEITTKNYAILNSVIDRYEEDIIQRKNRKFRRDLFDYQHGRVYTFSRKYDNIKDSNLSLDTPTNHEIPPSSEVESIDDSATCTLTRPQVNFLEEARRHRLGTLKDTRAKPPDITPATPNTSGIQTRVRSKTVQP